MKIFKLFFSVIIMVPGIFGVIALLFTIPILPMADDDVKLTAPIFGLIGLVLLYLGRILWDLPHRKMVTGIIFIIIGIFFLPICIIQLLNIKSFNFAILMYSIYGLIFLLLGILTIKKSLSPMKNVSIAEEQKKCPVCAENVQLEANFCKHCQYKFSGEEIESVRKKQMIKIKSELAPAEEIIYSSYKEMIQGNEDSENIERVLSKLKEQHKLSLKYIKNAIVKGKRCESLL